MKSIIFLVKLALIILAGVGLLMLPFKWITGIIFTLPLIYSLAIGLRPIPEEKRWVMEFLGKFYEVVGPGLYWRIPTLQKVRQAISIWEQRYPLFEKTIKIDFSNGSAVPKGTFVFVQIIGGEELREAKAKKQAAEKKRDEEALEMAAEEEREAEKIVKANAYKMVYGVIDVKAATISVLENASRSYLNGLSIEEGITEGRAGYDILKGMKDKGKKEELDGVKGALMNWGLEIRRVTVTDYDLDKAIINAREGVFKAERDAVAAESRALQKALESGEMHGQIKKGLMEKHGYDEEKAEEIAKEYVLYWKGSEEKILTQWRFEGESGGVGIYAEIAKIVAMIEAAKNILPRTRKKTKKEEGGEEKEED